MAVNRGRGGHGGVNVVPRAPVRLTGDGFVLRPYTVGDLARLRAVLTDPELARWNALPADPVELERWRARRNDWTAGDHASWAIGSPAGDELFGSVSIHQIDPAQDDAGIGYWLAPAARGRGLASGAVRLASRFGFEELGLARIYLHHAVGNVASCRVATAAGFLLEGTLRQSHRYDDGVHHDEHLHARLASD
jgi:RimJ/RimL family protein N-acetyltransferase